MQDGGKNKNPPVVLFCRFQEFNQISKTAFVPQTTNNVSLHSSNVSIDAFISATPHPPPGRAPRRSRAAPRAKLEEDAAKPRPSLVTIDGDLTESYLVGNFVWGAGWRQRVQDWGKNKNPPAVLFYRFQLIKQISKTVFVPQTTNNVSQQSSKLSIRALISATPHPPPERAFTAKPCSAASEASGTQFEEGRGEAASELRCN